MKVYQKSLYYEIAFDFVNINQQIKLFEKFIKRYSKIPVKRTLDIGSGPSKQARALALLGYKNVALDSSSEMLAYIKARAKDEGVKVETVKANFVKFSLPQKVDFAFILMGTIGYIASNKEFLSHLDSVAKALKTGGLYLIENFRLDWSDQKLFKPQSWTMETDGVSVKTTYSLILKNVIEQLLEENLKLEINDHSRKKIITNKFISKMIFPQELLELIKVNNKFEFLGFFERHDVKPLKKASMDNFVVLRRR